METLFQKILDLLVLTPGNFIYHLVLAFSVVASLQAAETVKLLLGLPSSLHNNWMHIDLKDTDFLLNER